MNIFISGHRDLAQEEFEQYYVPLINQGMYNDVKFYISNFGNCEFMAHEYFEKCKYYNVVVCLLQSSPNIVNNHFTVINSFLDNEERDVYMTEQTDRDIAWVRKTELSRTASNILRRFKMI